MCNIILKLPLHYKDFCAGGENSGTSGFRNANTLIKIENHQTVIEIQHMTVGRSQLSIDLQELRPILARGLPLFDGISMRRTAGADSAKRRETPAVLSP
jgi:hypothetical protein